MATMKTPGVYIVEKNAFPNSVVEVATAVPAFVGYTEKASNNGAPLLKKPFRIASLAEFERYFGRENAPLLDILPVDGKDSDITADFFASPTAGAAQAPYAVRHAKGNRRVLYWAMRHFFQNGGGPCYVVSVGDYKAAPDPDVLIGGVAALAAELEPTMVVIPDAVVLTEPQCIYVQQQMLSHCGEVMKNRFAILDVYDGWRERQDPKFQPIDKFRSDLGVNNLMWGAAYYPWVRTGILQDREISFDNFSNRKLLGGLLKASLDPAVLAKFGGVIDAAAQSDDEWKAAARKDWDDQNTAKGDAAVKGADAKKQGDDWAAANGDAWVAQQKGQTNATLASVIDLYGAIAKQAAIQVNLMPPSAAMAGVYCMVDNTRGVWKAPANVSLNNVTAPAVAISHDQQEDLNVTPTGKSINAIRAFIGEGVLVWGARTLDGNSLDWRYVNVRRTMIMLEESSRLAAKAMVFEPNVAGTWLTIKSMIQNFLTSVWKRGGLAGAVPEDAFSVFCGLGETMTSEDILEGILRVTVLVAVTRPAEFIEITFQQQMQKS